MAPARRSIGGGGGGHRRTCSRILRRNTMDCALLNEMFVINGDGGVATVCKKVDKRVQTLLRDSERQLKNSLATSFTNSAILKSFTARPNTGGDETDEKQDSSPSTEAVLRYHQPKVVESSNRYLSVTSRPIGCRASAPPQAFLSNTSNNGIKTSAFELRREFHDTFSNLIKLGSVDRQDAKVSIFVLFLNKSINIYIRFGFNYFIAILGRAHLANRSKGSNLVGIASLACRSHS